MSAVAGSVGNVLLSVSGGCGKEVGCCGDEAGNPEGEVVDVESGSGSVEMVKVVVPVQR